MNDNKDNRFKKRVNWFINAKLSVWGTKIAAQRHVAALRNALIANTGFLIVGSFFLIIDNFPITAWSGTGGILASNPWLDGLLLLPKKLTFDIMSFWTAGLLAYYLARTYKLNPLFPMISAAGAELALSPLSSNTDTWYKWWMEDGIPFNGYAGTSGILLAIVVGIIVTEFYQFLQKHHIRIPMPSAVPPAVSASFSAMIPIFLIFVIVIVLRGLFGITEYNYLPKLIENFLGKPISNGLVDTLGGVILISFLQSFGWCFGINSSAINGIVRPFWMELLPDNKHWQDIYNQTGVYHWDNFHKGTEDFYNFVTTGGAGSTLIIVIFMAIFARSDKLKMIARLCVIPGIFNINEPWMFGIPVVLNPLMWLPLMLAPMFSALIAFLAMDWHIVHMPAGLLNPWTLPVGVLGFFTNLHYSGAILQVVTALVAGAIWYPFMKFYDLQEFRTEKGIQTNNILATFRIAKKEGKLPPLFEFINPDRYLNQVNKKILKIKPLITELETDKNQFGLDLKIKKLKLKLREIKNSDFDGTKYLKHEPIINAKIITIQNEITNKKTKALAELNTKLQDYQTWLNYYEAIKDNEIAYIKLKNEQHKKLQLIKHKYKWYQWKKDYHSIKKINDTNKLEKTQFLYNQINNNQYHWKLNDKIQHYKIILTHTNNNSNFEKKLYLKIFEYEQKIKKLKKLKLIKYEKKLKKIKEIQHA